MSLALIGVFSFIYNSSIALLNSDFLSAPIVLQCALSRCDSLLFWTPQLTQLVMDFMLKKAWTKFVHLPVFIWLKISSFEPQSLIAFLNSLRLLFVIFSVIGSFSPEYDASKEEFDEATIKVYCGKQVKDQLIDPDSYKFESAKVLRRTGTYKQYGLGVLYFRSKNSFGGYVRGTAECKKFDQDGDGGAWIKATIQ